MRIGLDVMGGDYAPDAILAGGLDAVSLLQDGDRMVLVGDKQVIEAALAERKLDGDPRIEIEATTQIVAMDETPISAIRGMSMRGLSGGSLPIMRLILAMPSA